MPTHNFSIECTGIIRIIHPGVIPEEYKNTIGKEMNIILDSAKRDAVKSTNAFINDDYISKHGTDNLLNTIIKSYSKSFEKNISTFNKFKLRNYPVTYAFLENIFFIDLYEIVKDIGDADLSMQEYLESKKKDNKKLFGLEDDSDEEELPETLDDAEFISLYPEEEYEDYVDDDDDEWDDDENEGTTKEDFEIVSRYTLDIYKKATNIEVKDISATITQTAPFYRELFYKKNIQEALLVVPIIALAIRGMPSFIIKETPLGQISYLVRHDDGNFEEIE